MSWPTTLLERVPPLDWDKESLAVMYKAILEIQDILRGNLTLTSDTEELYSNLSTGITEVYWDETYPGSVMVEVDNPIGREPIGVIPIIPLIAWADYYDGAAAGSGWIFSRPSVFLPAVNPYPGTSSDGLNFTANSKTVTREASGLNFDSNQAKGYVIITDSGSANPGIRAKIDTIDTTSSLTLEDPWPGATESGQTGLIQWRWHEDSFFLAVNNQIAGGWARLLVF